MELNGAVLFLWFHRLDPSLLSNEGLGFRVQCLGFRGSQCQPSSSSPPLPQASTSPFPVTPDPPAPPTWLDGTHIRQRHGER